MPTRDVVLAQARLQAQVLTGALAFFLLVAFGCGAALGGRWNTGCIAAAWACAFFLPSFIVGMLFGVPKENGNPSTTLAMNGNFSQISDWATKMITGVTLVSAREIPSYCYRAGSYVGASIAASGAAASVGTAIGVMSGGLGFIAGYLFTSVYLTVVLDLTEQSLSVDAVVAGLSAEERSALMTDVEAPGRNASMAKLDRSGAVRKLQNLPVDPASSDSSLELVGNAKLRAGKFQDAEAVFSELVRRDAACYRFYWSLAAALYRLHRIPEAVETLERARPLVVGEPDARVRAFYEFLTYSCLRISYQKAILYAEEFFARGLDGAGVSLNYACAWGLKAQEKLKVDPNANIDAEAAAARKAVGEANAQVEDPALAVFRDRPEFSELRVH